MMIDVKRCNFFSSFSGFLFLSSFRIYILSALLCRQKGNAKRQPETMKWRRNVQNSALAVAENKSVVCMCLIYLIRAFDIDRHMVHGSNSHKKYFVCCKTRTKLCSALVFSPARHGSTQSRLLIVKQQQQRRKDSFAVQYKINYSSSN